MTTSAPLPPGTNGWPLLGETLSFLGDIFGFIRERTAKHGPVFRTRLLGNPTVIISGPDVTDLWLDETKIAREGSFPKNMQEIFGGRSLPLLDGEEHRRRKQLLLAGFDRAALASYLPVLEGVIGRYLERWSGAGEVRLLDELKQLAVEGICAPVLGLTPGADLDALLADYRLVTRGFTGIPVNLPGSAYGAALKARDRIFARLEAAVAAHRAAPTGDGLSRICAATAADGSALTAEQIKLELHHVILAGLIIFAELASIVTELAARPELRARLEAEIAAAGAGSGPLRVEQLARMPLLLHTMMEVKRRCPNVPVSFGRALQDLAIGGYHVPKGWFVFMAVGENNLRADSFASPESFDPDRFGEGRAEDRKPHAFQPQGAGSIERHHTCAGLEFSTLFMQVFTVLLLRGHTWTLPAQDLALRWSVVPPEPRDGLRAVVARR